MKYVFAGDRQISCDILQFLITKGYYPQALLVTEGSSSTHAEELIKISELNEEFIFRGKKDLESEHTYDFLKSIRPDYILGIHYPYIISNKIISIPSIGFLNLHPAFLPYNKGWHTPSWAIIDDTPYGATLHFMSEKLDEGDIIHQKKLDVLKNDTADSLYKKVLDLEKQVFYEAFDDLVKLNPPRFQQINQGTSHVKKDLEKVRKINLEDKTTNGELIDRLRALSTDKNSELAYFFIEEKKIGIKLTFIELDS